MSSDFQHNISGPQACADILRSRTTTARPTICHHRVKSFQLGHGPMVSHLPMMSHGLSFTLLVHGDDPHLVHEKETMFGPAGA